MIETHENPRASVIFTAAALDRRIVALCGPALSFFSQFAFEAGSSPARSATISPAARCGSASPACRAPARRCSSRRSSTTSIAGARLPVLAASAEGRIVRARLEPQPDDAVPRFAYEDHVAASRGPDRRWPQSTRRISQLRLTIEFESAAGWGARTLEPRRSTSSTIPANGCSTCRCSTRSYAEWSRETLDGERDARARAARRPNGARRSPASTRTPRRRGDGARASPSSSPPICARARDDVYALSTLPPGRFLMPGDLEGSPALTFAPLAARRGRGRSRRARWRR